MRQIPKYVPKQVEEETMAFWQANDIFKKSLEKNKDNEPYSFYDGPPFANGLPHFGHSLVTSIKDAIGRYQTMRGKYVERRNGWDCHGLPVEFEIEKKFNVSGKKQITELGIDKFNQACRDSVFTYKTDWEEFFDRIGRWTDKQNAYATIDTSYTESVWWAFSQIYKKGLIYKGFKCMPYCPRCATPLSNFELNEGYKDNVQDPSVFVKFQLEGENASLLAWTTTPWSLPGNAALAVKSNANYVRLKLNDQNGEELILAKDRLGELKSEDYTVLAEFSGKELVGKSYKPLFEIKGLENNPNLYKVWQAEFVSIEDGTGVLHVAPAFGEDDLELSSAHDIPVISSISPEGKIKEGLGLGELEGKFFKSADKMIIEKLTAEGSIYAAESFAHTYPFCYRCDTPLLYYAIDTWFIAVSKIKGLLLESAGDINWTPANIKDGRFGKWLEGARDWAISRNRYWGAPVPIWVNDNDEADIVVIESIAMLKDLSQNRYKLDDLHRPFIDEVKLEIDGKTYRRVEEVLDCWFESGSMPIAQKHFPFDSQDEFKTSFPADYIGEGLDQTRLWFYVMHVISTIIFDKPAYKNVLVNGMIMAADGQKLSKRLKNYPPLGEVFDDEGADSLRYYLLSSDPALSADYMRFDRSALRDINRNLFMTLYNSASFLSMYAKIDNWQPQSLKKPTDLGNPLDQWLVARVLACVKESTEAMDNYELAKASQPVYRLVDDMSNWYVRRSRRRFWKSEDDSDKLQAYATLHWALITTCQLLAPWSPFMSDWLYRHLSDGIKDAPESVHLTDWPTFDGLNEEVLLTMESVRAIVNEGLAKRAEAKIKVRQPLSQATIFLKSALEQELQSIIAEELNVKSVHQKMSETTKVELDLNLTESLKNEGIARDIIRNVQAARKEAGLEVENRIKLCITSPSGMIDSAVKEFSKLIAAETLAEEFDTSTQGYSFKKQATVEGEEIYIELDKK